VIGIKDGALQIWQIWPSRQALLDYARQTCGTCEPNYEQRVDFRLYNGFMLVFEYREILIAFWLGLFYILGSWVVYRGVFAHAAQPVPVRYPGFTWKRFVAAGGQGGLVVVLALMGILVIWLIEFFCFGDVIYDPEISDPRIVSEAERWSHCSSFCHSGSGQAEHIAILRDLTSRVGRGASVCG